MLCAAADGAIGTDSTGLFDYDTRILSRLRLRLDDRAPEIVSIAQPEADTLVGRYRLLRGGGSAAGPVLPEDALDIRLDRRVGAGMLDRWEITNRSALEWRGRLRLEVDADFADTAEVGRERRQKGEVTARLGQRSLELRYEARRDGQRFKRAVRVWLLAGRGSPQVPVDVSDEGFTAQLSIGPRAATTIVVRVSSRVGGAWRSPGGPAALVDGGSRAQARTAWRISRPRLEAPERLRQPVERALDDLFALRNDDLEKDLLETPDGVRKPGWILNAGVPTLTGFFGRDAITSGWQSAMAGTAALRGALEVTAATQAAEDDPWRDAAPGKMLQELRRGPVSMLGLSPRDASDGSQTMPPLFLTGLSELWHWTGDDALLRRFRDAARKAVAWAERSQDSRGFVRTERRSPAGLANEAWTDSDEAIRHADGRLVRGAIATVEEQAFHFLALQRLAEVEIALGDERAGDALLRRAEALRASWHAAFWMPREGFYARALDGEDDQVTSIASNPGHALATGIVPPDHARLVADRLLAPDLFNGWGVRTLSAEHPSFNPLGYRLGTVWPVENATFALGFKRYGLNEHLDRLATAFFEAAAASPEGRLPELLTGHRREPGVPPSPYPNACSPQAWSASAVVSMLQIVLGLYPFAPLQILALVRPRLPQSIPELTLRNVRIGRASVDLRFTRRPDGSASHKVLRTEGTLHVVPAGPPSAAIGRPASWLEQAERALLTRAPGRLVRAARIAIGIEGPA
ncbi:MAG TPA: glycogen debranching N-terminal domain-containing protein [Candidatus Binatia bacterium]|nr:glycogen debranching N-terminal domain-containing protein [Candidatus Binatia bacterium]